MGKKKENIEEFTREFIQGIDATEEQIQFLIKEYMDKRGIIGIHNTDFEYESFFEKGLTNNTSLDQKTQDLTNTVAYASMLVALLNYPNGDGNRRGETAIILKIPNKVLQHKQGIFETLQDKEYGIPPQFIKAAFCDGKIIMNPSYDEKYCSKTADLCDNVINRGKNRRLQLKIFNELYYGKESFWKRMRKKLNIGKGKIECIGDGKIPTIQQRGNNFLESLQQQSPSWEEQERFAQQYSVKMEEHSQGSTIDEKSQIKGD